MSYYSSSYAAGDTFIDYTGNKYTVVTGGTTPTTPFDKTNTNASGNVEWGSLELTPISDESGGISIWAASTTYAVDDVVIYDNLIYRCITAHTSSSTFSDTYWTCISGGDIANGYEVVSLWSGTYSFSNSTEGGTSPSTTIELSDDYTNYEYLLVEILEGSTDGNTVSALWNTAKDSARVSIFATPSYYTTVQLKAYDSTHLYAIWQSTAGWTTGYAYSIKGIKKASPIVSSGMIYETLWEGEAGSTNNVDTTITTALSQPYTKYKKLGFYCKCYYNDLNWNYWYREVDTAALTEFLSGTYAADVFMDISFCYFNTTENWDSYLCINTNSSTNNLQYSIKRSFVLKVVGITEGVQIPTGVQAARVTLWSGTQTSSATLTLSDDFTNYDIIEVAYSHTIGSRQDYNVATFYPSQLTTTLTSGKLLLLGFNDLNSELYATSSTTVQFEYDSCRLYSIIGIKYIQPDSYSTEEKMIGTWIDGSILYRKVYDTPTLPLTTGLTNTDTNIKDIRIFGHDTSGAQYPLCYGDGTSFRSVYWNNGTIYLAGNLTAYTPEHLIIEYTKN